MGKTVLMMKLITKTSKHTPMKNSDMKDAQNIDLCQEMLPPV
jgi:hypothetical protein